MGQHSNTKIILREKTELKKNQTTEGAHGMAKEKKKTKRKMKKNQEQIMEEDKAYSTRELEEDFS